MADNEGDDFQAFLGIKKNGTVVHLRTEERPDDSDPLLKYVHSLLSRHVEGDSAFKTYVVGMTDNLVFIIRHQLGFHVQPRDISILATDTYDESRGWTTSHKIAVVYHTHAEKMRVLASVTDINPKKLQMKLKMTIEKMVNDILYGNKEKVNLPISEKQ